VRLTAAEDDLLDLFLAELRDLGKGVADAVRSQIVRPRHVEGPAM
jgi:hypothetical protein